MPSPQLDELLRSLDRAGHDLTPGGLLTRSIARTIQYQRTGDGGLLPPALDDFRAAGRLVPLDPALLRWTVLRQLEGAVAGHPVDFAALEAEVNAAGEDPRDPGASVVLRGMIYSASSLNDDSGADTAARLQALDDLDECVPEDSEYAVIVGFLRLAMLIRRGVDRNDLGVVREVVAWARRAIDDPRLSDERRTYVSLIGLSGEMADAAQRGEYDAVRARGAALKALLDDSPNENPALNQIRSMYQLAFAALPGVGGTAPPGKAPEYFVADPGLTGSERAFRQITAALGDFQRAYEARDLNGVRRAIDDQREAVRQTPSDNPHLVKYRALLGGMLHTLYEVTREEPLLTEAGEELSLAKEAAASPRHPAWAAVAQGLFDVHRAAGRDRDAREIALDGLRGHTWSVLLQPDSADATLAAANAIDDAVAVARAYLAVDDVDTAATALDTGRGLLLYATSVVGDIPQRLEAADAADLAAEWRRTGGAPSDIASDLRYRALAVLTDAARTDATGPQGLLDPPDLAEVRAALATLGADALVYLVAASLAGVDSRTREAAPTALFVRPRPDNDAAHGGIAVVVPRSATAFQLDLPALTEPPRIMTEGSAPWAVRDLVARQPPTDLNAVCDWAWRAAVGPLLDALPTADPARIVLIPFGALAAVPWHAARSPAGSYAVEHAVISYAASARLLCRTTWRTPVAYDRGGMIVADPTGDLPNARVEALAVRDAFYPKATLTGADLEPQRLEEWLRTGRSGRSTLHLACHGVVGRGGGQESYLILADHARLTAQRVLTTDSSSAVDVVTLAACTTAVAAGAYDEAFSLSTAFLVAGARTVFGSLWAIPDDATPLLTFMTHHYLRVDGLRPADALRAAQLWMLEPQRVPPAAMPAALAAIACTYRADQVESWAGFNHLGR